MTPTHTRAVEKPQGESQTRQPTYKPLTPVAPTPEERYESVAKAAYLRAEHRGFLPGWELNDWLDAEAEFDKVLTQAS